MARGRAWLWAAVWTALALGACAQRPLACEIVCCDLMPHCSNATSMSCDCPNSHEMRLREGSIPKTVKYVHISNARTVVIGRNLIYALYALRDLVIMDVDSVDVHSDGLAQSAASSLQQLRLERVHTVELRRESLSGTWRGDAVITLHRVKYLRLGGLAFHFSGVLPGPRVVLDLVGDLHAERHAFKATIGHLSLVNVTMRVCRPDTFRGEITSLELLGCRLDSLESGCLRAEEGWRRVAVRACRLGAVRRRALSGPVDAVLLEASTVDVMHEGALQLQVDRLELQRVDVAEMGPRALNVTACTSVRLVESRVALLRALALAAVRLSNCEHSDVHPFTVHLLHVGDAENGSLAVHADLPAAAVNWDSLMLDADCSCQAAELARQLVAGGSTAPLTDTQRELAEHVSRSGYCRDEHGGAERLADAATACRSASGGAVSLDQDVVFYGVLPVPAQDSRKCSVTDL
ncbi:uncharacterized protein LOC119100424 [Pollicipes pollicipes]|uniref:uncharacterized protein LOC119100424 n=1 Tax=Pollicipes pollicipes TaxID=41117 RepID=UPI001884EAAE|nr:uncharacterized protein LOC119100424 [Pollicipes pollicipes]